MKVYVVYSGNGYTFGPPVAVFSNEDDANIYAKKESHSYVDAMDLREHKCKESDKDPNNPYW